MSLTIGDALTKIQKSGVSAITGQALLAHVARQPREWLLAHHEASLNSQQERRFDHLLGRAAQGEPLAYLTEEKEFCGVVFTVTPVVLIPRPETEMLVEAAEEWAGKSANQNPVIADVGTGSGAIAIAVALRVSEARVNGTDVSMHALEVAWKNAVRLGVDERIQFEMGDLLSSVDGPQDVILANLPYIPTETLIGLEVSHWEPAVALDGGEDGLDLIRRLVDQAATRLSPGGMLALEIQFDQGERVSKLCRAAFPNGEVSVLKDLAGLDRVVKVGLSN